MKHENEVISSSSNYFVIDEAPTRESQILRLTEELMSFELSPRVMDRDIDPFQWWNQNGNASELFRELAWTVLSFPVTQVNLKLHRK